MVHAYIYKKNEKHRLIAKWEIKLKDLKENEEAFKKEMQF